MAKKSKKRDVYFEDYNNVAGAGDSITEAVVMFALFLVCLILIKIFL